MRKTIWLTLFCVGISLALNAPVPAGEKKLKMGIMQWTCESLPSHVVVNALKDRLGYTVETEDMFEWGVAFAAMGKGDVHLMLGEPSFVQGDYWDESRKKLEIVSPIGFGLYQALVVPGYVPINSTEELNAHKEKFGGKIIGIEAGSGLMRQTKDAVAAYGLDLTLVEGSTAAMNSALKSAIDKQKWIVVTSWTPTWWHQTYDLKFLKDPKGIYPKAVPQHIMATGGFCDTYPDAARLLRSMYIPLDDILLMSSWVKEGSSVEQAAKRWCEENTHVIDRWAALANID